MIITMNPNASGEEIQSVEKIIQEAGYQVHPIYGTNLTVLAAVGDERGKEGLFETLTSQPMVDKVEYILPPYKLVCREVKKDIARPDSTIEVSFKWKEGKKSFGIGGTEFIAAAGPCSVENEDQIMACARMAKQHGASMLRGGAYKPRTSPYSFQGLEEEGLLLLARAREEYGLAVCTELMDAHHLELLDKYADVIQIGARNMQNFFLLKALGQTQKPILLKRGMSSTLDEWLMSAEYIMSRGNPNVILCERGIRTFETKYRNSLDLNAVPALKKLTHLPVIVDPSHGTGIRDMVLPMSLAAAASGCHGVIVEIHPNPSKAFSDGAQSLTEEGFKELMDRLPPVIRAVGKRPQWESQASESLAQEKEMK
ncbi:3-deoxy-7-phosphoheptulonate synthase [bacterium]|nr:3-deoxy-7-phosphoheptulonate synthase [bacterium]